MDNAASPKNIKAKGSREERLRQREVDDLKVVLSSIHGKRLIWRLLSKCGTFQSVHHPSGSQVYYNAGKQDLGHFLMTEIVEADPPKLIEMMVNAKDFENV